MRPFITILVSSALCLISSAPVEQAGGLYGENEPFVQLNEENFEDVILHTPNFWFIQFYSSWCGHCRRFKPVWLSIASELHSYEPYLKVAAMDCGADENVEICRKLKVEGFPTLRYFKPNAVKGDIGVDMDRRKFEDPEAPGEYIRGVLHYLSDNSNAETYYAMPKLKPFGNFKSLLHFAEKEKPSAKTVLAVLPDPLEKSSQQDLFATEIILCLSKYTEMFVGRINAKNKSALSSIDSYPALLKLDPKSPQNFINILPASRGRTANDFIDAIREVFKLPSGDKEYRFPFAIQNKVDDIDPKWADHVYEDDLLLTIQYALFHEVNLHTSLDASRVDALKAFVYSLAHYASLSPQYQLYLQQLFDKLQAVPAEIKSISNVDYVSLLNAADANNASKPMASKWYHCQGSDASFRGYPCGLWTLFHTLTAICAADDSVDVDECVTVLNGIKGYVKYFFTCHDCANNFEAETIKQTHQLEVKSDVVLWLWKIHNAANRRLANDKATLDPKFPKIQFPSAIKCPDCHQSPTKFVESEVAGYLMKFYSVENRLSGQQAAFIRNVVRTHRERHNAELAASKNGQQVENKRLAMKDVRENMIRVKYDSFAERSRKMAGAQDILESKTLAASHSWVWDLICIIMLYLIIVFALYYFVKYRKLKVKLMSSKML